MQYGSPARDGRADGGLRAVLARLARCLARSEKRLSRSRTALRTPGSGRDTPSTDAAPLHRRN
eukprot:360533-Chlamydomonas_euryale.AAC.1